MNILKAFSNELGYINVSKYNWNKILRANRESIISVAGTVSDDVRKRNTKIVNFLAQTYPAKNQPELVDCLQSFVL